MEGGVSKVVWEKPNQDIPIQQAMPITLHVLPKAGSQKVQVDLT